MAQFINPPFIEIFRDTGTVETTATGFVADPLPILLYEIIGSVATVCVVDFNGASNSTDMTIALPANLVPLADQQTLPIFGLTDNSVGIYLGCGVILTRVSAAITFAINGDSVTPFTAAGTKGVPVAFTISYLLGDGS